MSIKGTKTEQNLLKSFAGESQARSRYTFFASVAKKEGFEQIAGVFMETAEQEKEHAKRFFKFLEGGMVEITASYPAGVIGTTAENLKAAAEGENEEWADLYPEKIALIPQQTDILVSHCPPFGILDKSAFGANMGNEDLRKQVEIINPRYHLFGHIHEAYGVYKTSRTTFVNGAVVDENYERVNHPVVITI